MVSKFVRYSRSYSFNTLNNFMITKEKILDNFDTEFCNDHNRKIRFLRGVFIDQEDQIITIKDFISTSIDSLLQDVLSEADKYGDRLFNRCLVLEQERKENTNEYSNIRCELNGISQVKELIKSKSSSIN